MGELGTICDVLDDLFKAIENAYHERNLGVVKDPAGGNEP
jgi:hypothetical protein